MLGASGTVSPRFASLQKAATAGTDGPRQDGSAIRKTLLVAPPDKRLALMVSFLRDKVARVLGASAARVVVDKPLTELGLDSLMAVELRNWMEAELRVDLPLVELMQGPSITRLAELLLVRLTAGDAPRADRPAEGPTAPAIPSTPAVKEPANGNAPANDLQGGPGGLVSPPGSSATQEVDREVAKGLLDTLDDLSDAEVDSLLDSMLAEKEQQQ
jgi:aryl carrier-like protein